MNFSIRRALARASVLLPVIAGVVVAQAPSAAADEPQGTAFGRGCGWVTVLAVPGSYETSEKAGFHHAVAMLENVTGPAENESVRVHYLGYPAQIVQVTGSGLNLTLTPVYDQSRSDGYHAAWSTLDYYAHQCPGTQFVLMGYSQGAHIAGDLAATIGKESSPVSPDRVRAVELLADPARSADHTPLVGMAAGQVGDLGGITPVDRGDFGALDAKVTEYCNPADGLCNANPETLGSLAAALLAGRGPHTEYDQTTVAGTDQTFTERMRSDLLERLAAINDPTF